MPLLPEFFPGVTGFQWDAGNSEKNWLQHGPAGDPGNVTQVFHLLAPRFPAAWHAKRLARDGDGRWCPTRGRPA